MQSVDVLVHVIGLPGAGKTTLTADLGPVLGWPVFSIGAFREDRSPDLTGEHEAWEALHEALAERGFSEAILETSGLNGRAHRIENEVPDDELVRVKLVCPTELLHQRVRERETDDEPSSWAFSDIPDRHAFIDRFQGRFEELDADIEIDTSEHEPSEVLAIMQRELSASESYPIEPPEPGEPARLARRTLAQSSGLDQRILTSLSKETQRRSELEAIFDGAADRKLTAALERLQREGLIRRRSGDGEGQDIHRYELSSLGRHTLLAIDEIQET